MAVLLATGGERPARLNFRHELGHVKAMIKGKKGKGTFHDLADIHPDLEPQQHEKPE